MDDLTPASLPVGLSVDAEILSDTLDSDVALRSLVLSLMSRLLVTKALAARVEEGRIRVEAVFGTPRFDLGDELSFSLPFESVAVGEEVPPSLREAGFSLLIPLRYKGLLEGLIAFGPRRDGRPFSRENIAMARSLADVAAVAIHATHTGRTLAGRVQDLQTLLEMATAFGECLNREEVASRLALAAMGRWMTRKAVVGLAKGRPEDVLELAVVRGVDGAVHIPGALAERNAPFEVDDAELTSAGLEWSIPLRAADTTRGVLILGEREGGRRYPEADSPFASALAALAVGALEAIDRVEERLARERLEEELRFARRIQEQLLPDKIPSLPGFEVAATWQPGTTVSGDFYDVECLGQDRIVFAVADGMGHGVPAALLAATLQAGLRLLREEAGLEIAAATSRLNALLRRNAGASQFVTLVWGILKADGAVRYVTAGHPPPRLTHADGRVEELAVGGPLLGVVPDAAYDAGSARLSWGDRLVLYTDGVTEAQNAEGEQFGISRIDDVMTSTTGDAAALVLALQKALDRFSDVTREADDRTVLLLQRSG